MIIAELLRKHPDLIGCKKEIETACGWITAAFRKRKKLLLCGNGGSAADSDHISVEFLKGFMSKRPLSAAQKKKLISTAGEKGRFIAGRLQIGFPAIPLTSLNTLLTAFANDVAPELSFAQGVNALGDRGDLLFGISTSGEADNVIYAAMTARARGLKTIALTGKGGGRLAKVSDLSIIAPGTVTPDIQELHQPIYHAICREVEARLIRN